MGSGGGGGVDAEPRRDPYADPRKAAGSRTDATRMSGVRKREEERLRRASFVSGDQSYVTGGGDIVRDTSGGGVLTRTGVQRAEASRQEELETLISRRQGGSGDPEAGKRQMAIEQLEKRKEQTLPGFLGAVSRMNIERQLADLKAGGTPQFGLSPTGTFITRGVTPQGQEAPGAAANIQPMFGAMGVDSTRTPEITPEVTEEFVPDDRTLMGAADRGRGRGETRRTRVAGAGSLKTGYGVLLRGPRVTAPSGSGRLS